MLLQVFSDLHADVAPVRPIVIAPRLDAVVIAGDVCEGLAEALRHARALVPAAIPIVFVAGNHEHYGRNLDNELAAGRRIAPELGIHFLEDDSAMVGSVRFLGATLWTDFEFWGADKREVAMAVAGASMNDHQRITHTPGGIRFMPADARARHLASRAFLEARLARRHRGRTVVVTHHLPHEASIHMRFRASPLNVAFASDLAEMILRHRPALWVHGHTHGSVDARIGSTRIVCNPHGYGAENPAFDPCLVVEV